MKYYTRVLALAALLTAPAFAADVGVSISIGQPGFFGRIDLDNYSQPAVIYARPIVIQRAPRGEVYEPLYLRVPRSHSRNWRRYCSRYDACGRPVYFVQDDWYNNVYSPHYREAHGSGRNERDERGDRHDQGNKHDHKKGGRHD